MLGVRGVQNNQEPDAIFGSAHHSHEQVCHQRGEDHQIAFQSSHSEEHFGVSAEGDDIPHRENSGKGALHLFLQGGR